MKFIRWAVVATLTAMFHLHAQTPASVSPSPASAAGPTMEQTIAFINERLAKQGETFQLSNKCDLVHTITHADPDTPGKIYTGRSLFRLDHTDPLSIEVFPYAIDGVTTYTLEAKRAVCLNLPGPTSATVPTVHPPSNYELVAIVHAVSEKVLTVISSDGQLLDIPLVDGVEVRREDVTANGVNMPVTNVSDIAVGDMVSISEELKMKGSKIKSIDQSILVTKNTEAQKEYAFAVLSDKETAEHLAKAFIHAIVLCHKPEVPALF